jgi:hypothetical protein
MLRYVEARCAAVRDARAKLFSSSTYILLMSFLRIKTITKNGRTYNTNGPKL